jgi:hypothetical protein
MNQFPPAPEYSIKTVSNFLRKFAEIRKSRYTTDGINDTGGKFATGVNDTLSCEYLRDFRKKILMVKSGTWGKLTHEKNQKQNIS